MNAFPIPARINLIETLQYENRAYVKTPWSRKLVDEHDCYHDYDMVDDEYRERMRQERVLDVYYDKIRDWTIWT